jgi:hypothetical protein
VKRRWKKINRKITALTLLLITSFAVIVGGFLLTAHAENSTTTALSTSTTNLDELNTTASVIPFWGMGSMRMGEQGFGPGPRGHGPQRNGYGNIEVSSEYTQKVNDILNNDTEVQNLVTQGYNVTSIRPIIKNIIAADGALTTKATTATVTLQNGTSGIAVANVDIEQEKVTQIVILTRTVIDKTNS